MVKKSKYVTHIIGYFGTCLLAIDGEVKFSGSLNCSSRDLAEKTTIDIRGELYIIAAP